MQHFANVRFIHSKCSISLTSFFRLEFEKYKEVILHYYELFRFLLLVQYIFSYSKSIQKYLKYAPECACVQAHSKAQTHAHIHNFPTELQGSFNNFQVKDILTFDRFK